MRDGTRLATFVVRTELRSRWASWIAVGLLVGLVTGGAIALAAGARRTASTFARYERVTSPADLVIETAQLNPPVDPVEEIRSTPGVEAIRRTTGFAEGVVFVVRDGALTLPPTETAAVVVDDRDAGDRGRPLVLRGRLPRDGTPEVLVNEQWVERTGFGVGSEVELRTFLGPAFVDDEGHPRVSLDELTARFDADPTIGRGVELTVVGVAVTATNEVVGDPSVVAGRIYLDLPQAMELTGFDVATLTTPDQFSTVEVFLGDGVDVERIDDELMGHAFDLSHPQTLSDMRSRARLAVQPYVVALWVACALALVALVLVVGPILTRQAHADARSHPVLHAIGADQRSLLTAAAARAAIVGLTAVVVAASVAIAASVLFPIGPLQRIEPSSGRHLDWLVLGAGVGAAGLFSLAAALVAARRVRLRSGASTRSRTGGIVDALGRRLPLEAALGVRFAAPREPGLRANALTTAGAIAVGLAASFAVLTFAADVDAVVGEPERYGAGWDVALTCSQGYCGGDALFATPGLQELLDDPAIAAWGFGFFAQAIALDGLLVTTVTEISERGEVRASSIVEGRFPEADDEVALGSDTMRALGASIGSVVRADSGRELRVVGRAVFSGFGPVDQTRATLGDGAVLTPSALDDITGIPGIANALLLRTTLTADDVAARLGGLTALDASPPGSLAAWRSLRWLPTTLAAAFVCLALAALVHGLRLSRRLRRLDFAILAALGCEPRQLRRVARAHAAVVLVATGVGASAVGSLAGQAAWRAYAHDLGVTPHAPAVAAGALLALAAAVVAGIALAAATTRRTLSRTTDVVREREVALARTM